MDKVKTYIEMPDDYWTFIEEHLPDYSSRDDVLKSDILARYVFGEEVCDEDLEWLPSDKEEARSMAAELDLSLYNEAVEAYNKKMASYFYRYYTFAKEARTDLSNHIASKKEIDVAKYNYFVVVTERHCGETFTDKLVALSSKGFMTEEYDTQWFSYDEMALADVCNILDSLISGEWNSDIN